MFALEGTLAEIIDIRTNEDTRNDIVQYLILNSDDGVHPNMFKENNNTSNNHGSGNESAGSPQKLKR